MRVSIQKRLIFRFQTSLSMFVINKQLVHVQTSMVCNQIRVSGWGKNKRT